MRGPLRRAVVYGSSGAGKSTFAAELSRLLNAPVVELDLLAYDPDGAHVEQEVLQQRFEKSIRRDAWVAEGMHRDQLNRALELADLFVWLDYSKLTVLRRLTARLVRQLLLRAERHGRSTSLASAWRRDLPFIRKTIRNHGRRREHAAALADRARSLGVRVERVTSARGATLLLAGEAPVLSGSAGRPMRSFNAPRTPEDSPADRASPGAAAGGTPSPGSTAALQEIP